MCRKGNPFALLMEMQIGVATAPTVFFIVLKNTMELLQKLKMELLYDPLKSLLEIYPMKPETLI